MKIKWLEDVDIEIWNCREEYECEEDYDEDADNFECESDITKTGEIEEIDVLDENEDTIDMQFGNGSVAYGVPRECFEIIEED